MEPSPAVLRRELFACIVLAGLCLAIFWRTPGFAFINFDDNSYVSENRFVKQGLTSTSIAAAFTETFNGHWHPLTMLSYMLDTALFGFHAGGYHLTNTLLHVVNTLLLFLLLREMTGFFFRSGIVAALFAAHPLHVEPVAWIASRKDVLSAFFLILALFAYTAWVRKGGRQRYGLLIVWLVLGLLSKAILVTLPVLLLLLDYWPLNRYRDVRPAALSGYFARARSLFVEKAPLFGIVVVFAMATVFTQSRAGAMTSLQDLSFPARLANALVAYCVYLVKTVWPVNLAPFYPHGGEDTPLLLVGLALASLTGITLGVLAASRRAPYLLMGWCWFAVTLLPVSGLMQAGIQAYADRYTYVPLIGVFVAAVWGLGHLVQRKIAYRLVTGAAWMAVVLVLTLVSARQIRHWENDVTLFEHTLRVTEDNYVAHMILGNAYHLRGRTDDAVEHYRKSLAIEPNDATTYAAMAVALASQGKFDGALSHYETAVLLKPDYAFARANFGALLLTMGRSDEAVDQFRGALETDPYQTLALNGLGLAMAQQHDFEEAERLLRRGLAVDPANASLHKDLGLVLAQAGDHDDSLRHFEQAVALAPEDPDAHNNLAILYAERSQFVEAIAHFQEALRLHPDHPTARINLERCLAEQAGRALNGGARD